MGRLFQPYFSQFGPSSTVKPKEFYDLGTAVAGEAGSEAERRMAAGRIYYGLHHEACCRFFRVNPRELYLDRKNRHSGLVSKFRACRNNEHALRIGSLLDQLRRLRTTADYDLATMSFNRQLISDTDMLATVLQTSKMLADALERFSPGEAGDGCKCVSV